MIVKKRVHKLWQEEKNYPTPLYDNMFGKYQYLCDSPKGHISIIELTEHDSNIIWEIWSNETLFKGCQQFDSLKEALNKASDYLD